MACWSVSLALYHFKMAAEWVPKTTLSTSHAYDINLNSWERWKSTYWRWKAEKTAFEVKSFAMNTQIS